MIKIEKSKNLFFFGLIALFFLLIVLPVILALLGAPLGEDEFDGVFSTMPPLPIAEITKEQTEPVSISTATIMPAPTLSRQAFADIHADVCELPCVWGIVPGITTEAELLKILSGLEGDFFPYKDRNQSTGYEVTYYFDIPYGGEYLTHTKFEHIDLTFKIYEGVVGKISTEASAVANQYDVSLVDLVSVLGEPEDVKLDIMLDDNYFKVFMVYGDQGYSINFSGELKKNDDQYLLCLDEAEGYFTAGPFVRMWDTNKFSFDDVPIDAYLYHPLVDFTPEYTNSEFYDLAIDAENNNCVPYIFDFPSESSQEYSANAPLFHQKVTLIETLYMDESSDDLESSQLESAFLDLDTLTYGSSPDADIQLTFSYGTMLFYILKPVNSAKHSHHDNIIPTKDSCLENIDLIQGESGFQMGRGEYVCFLTNQGRLAVLTITDAESFWPDGEVGERLEFEVTVWDIDN